jgi:hypothetical protein
VGDGEKEWSSLWGQRLIRIWMLKLCFLFVCFPFTVVRGGGTLWQLQRFLQCIKYFILEFTPSMAPLYPPFLPFMEQFQQVSFLHLHAFVHIFLHCIHSPTPFPYHLPLPQRQPSPRGRTCSVLLFSDFAEEKEKT